jgi:hypothetical protein
LCRRRITAVLYNCRDGFFDSVSLSESLNASEIDNIQPFVGLSQSWHRYCTPHKQVEKSCLLMRSSRETGRSGDVQKCHPKSYLFGSQGGDSNQEIFTIRRQLDSVDVQLWLERELKLLLLDDRPDMLKGVCSWILSQKRRSLPTMLESITWFFSGAGLRRTCCLPEQYGDVHSKIG